MAGKRGLGHPVGDGPMHGYSKIHATHQAQQVGDAVTAMAARRVHSGMLPVVRVLMRAVDQDGLPGRVGAQTVYIDVRQHPVAQHGQGDPDDEQALRQRFSEQGWDHGAAV